MKRLSYIEDARCLKVKQTITSLFLMISLNNLVLSLEILCGLEFGHPLCVCNNEVKYNEGQKASKFIS